MSHAEAKEAWIDWRCQVLYRHYAQMADRISAARPGLKLKLNFFLHPSQNHRLADYLNEPSSVLMREMGIDPELYRNHSNIILSPTTVPSDFRWMRRSDYLADHPGVSRGVFTAPEVAAPLKEHHNVRVTIHDRYWEDAIGKEEQTPAEPTPPLPPNCEMVPVQREFRRPIAYDVDYVYRGLKYRSRLPYDPGNRLRVQVSIQPYVAPQGTD